MSEKDINPQKPITAVLKTSSEVETVRGKYWMVKKVNPEDLAQWARAIKAYKIAHMPFEHLGNTGKILGNEVESGEIDAPLQVGWSENTEIIQNDHQVIGVQSRGERVAVERQLTSGSGSRAEIIEISGYLPTTQNITDQTIDVVEGIDVESNKPQSLTNQENSSLENNPYLIAPADLLKKAA